MRNRNAKTTPPPPAPLSVAAPGPVGVPASRGATLRGGLPRLELLRCFEAAARHLSFTSAGRELHLTQSAVSRQIQQLEEELGAALFERRHRALALTAAGAVCQRAVSDSLQRLRDATALVRAPQAVRQVSITCTPGFASLWLIPRLARFTASHPQVDVRLSATLDVVDLQRSDIDVAVRFFPIQQGAGEPLFEESVLPLCAPALVRGGAHQLRRPADLAHHTLLTVEVPQGMALTVEWEPWLRIMGLANVQMKNTLRFTQYADAVAAAVAGQGVVIGRLPLLRELVNSGQLVAPFEPRAASSRAYYVATGPRAAANPDAQDFVRWLRAEGRAADVH